VAPLPVKVTSSPAHIEVEVVLATTCGAGLTFTITLAVDEQPPALEITTVYSVVSVGDTPVGF
jgi:hypothetical protein